MTQKQFYKSRPWLRCRAGYIAYRKSIDGGLCEECGEDLGYIVHHKIWLDDERCNDPEIALNYSNLEYVCLNCHNRIENPEERKHPTRYRIGKDGEILPL